MAWYSLLPTHLTVYETWVIRVFIILAIINISPWAIAILYDLFLYIARRVWHEMPIWGGRARGEVRPRAPALRDRTRRMSIAEMIGGGGGGGSGSPARKLDQERAELRKRQNQKNSNNQGTILEADEPEEERG